MKWILLPGFDGTGTLFAPFLRALPPGIEPVVVTYPADRNPSADELVGFVLKRLPESEPFVLIAESFSGPIALKSDFAGSTPGFGPGHFAIPGPDPTRQSKISFPQR
jgi:hypothetical protein